MGKIWVLVANSSNATLMSADSPIAALEVTNSFENPDARAKIMELTSDRPGRSFDTQGDGRHAMEVEIDPKEQLQIRFAKQLTDYLEQGRLANAFKRLVIVASPAFLGILRTNFSAPLKALVSLEIGKDYTSLTHKELRARLPTRI